MPDTTPVYSLPFLEPADPPDIPSDGEDSMLAVEAELARIDAAAAAALPVGVGAWTPFTPTWVSTGTNPSIGNGSLAGAYMRVGRLIAFRIKVTLGSTSTPGTGNYIFGGLPVIPHDVNESNGAGMATDGSSRYMAMWYVGGGGQLVLVTPSGAVSATSPFVPNSGDYYTLSGLYEAVS